MASLDETVRSELTDFAEGNLSRLYRLIKPSCSLNTHFRVMAGANTHDDVLSEYRFFHADNLGGALPTDVLHRILNDACAVLKDAGHVVHPDDLPKVLQASLARATREKELQAD